MRIATLFVLSWLTLTGSAQALPTDYPGQVRLLLGSGNALRNMDSLEPIAQKERNHSLIALIAICRIKEQFDPYRNRRTVLEAALRTQLAEFDARGATELHIHTLLVLSEYYWHFGDPGRALEYGLRAYDRYHVLSDEVFPMKYLALYELATKFYHFEDYPTAARYGAEAVAVQHAVPDGPHYIGYNLLGLCYRNYGRYDSAARYFTLGREQAQDAGSILWERIIGGNLGITNYQLGRYQDAVPLLEADIAASLHQDAALDNAVNSMAVLAAIHRAQGRPEDAGRLLNEAWRISREQGFARNYKLMARLYPELARERAAVGDAAGAARFWQGAAEVQDSLARALRTSVVAGAQLRVDAERHLSQQMLLSQELASQKSVRNSLLAGIVLLTIIGLLLIQKLQARHRYQQERAAEHLQEATARLDTYMQVLHEKNALLERLQGELERAGNFRTPVQEATLDELRRLTILTDDEWNRFQTLFEQVHSGYLQRLQHKLPGLTPADTRYITLLKLRFSNREIAGVLGIGASSVRTTRSRLRKRLGLAEDEALEAVIETI